MRYRTSKYIEWPHYPSRWFPDIAEYVSACHARQTRRVCLPEGRPVRRMRVWWLFCIIGIYESYFDGGVACFVFTWLCVCHFPNRLVRTDMNIGFICGGTLCVRVNLHIVCFRCACLRVSVCVGVFLCSQMFVYIRMMFALNRCRYNGEALHGVSWLNCPFILHAKY